MYIDAYHTLFSGTGIHYLNEDNSISRETYANGYCLFAFDLTPDLSANQDTHWNLVKHGSVRIDVRFDDPLSSTVNGIIYAEYENILEIHHVKFSWTPVGEMVVVGKVVVVGSSGGGVKLTGQEMLSVAAVVDWTLMCSKL